MNKQRRDRPRLSQFGTTDSLGQFLLGALTGLVLLDTVPDVSRETGNGCSLPGGGCLPSTASGLLGRSAAAETLWVAASTHESRAGMCPGHTACTNRRLPYATLRGHLFGPKPKPTHQNPPGTAYSLRSYLRTAVFMETDHGTPLYGIPVRRHSQYN